MHEPVELKSVVYDNTSGAREIAVRSLQLLQRVATQSTAASVAELVDELADVSVKVLRSKPEMGVVFAALNRALQDTESFEDDGADLGEFRIQTIARLQDQVRRLDEQLLAAAAHGAALVQNGDVILTYSRSSTVLAALKRAKADGKLFDVVTAESRPMLEGRSLAKDLAEDQIPVRLLVDALLGTAVVGADRVFVGADAITQDAIVNKAGTRLLALAARERKVPLVVLADTGKAWLKRADPAVSLLSGRLRDPKEVWDQAPYGIEIVNLYFDETPLPWFANVVCEDGVLAPHDYWSHVKRLGFSRRIAAAFRDELA